MAARRARRDAGVRPVMQESDVPVRARRVAPACRLCDSASLKRVARGNSYGGTIVLTLRRERVGDGRLRGKSEQIADPGDDDMIELVFSTTCSSRPRSLEHDGSFGAGSRFKLVFEFARGYSG